MVSQCGELRGVRHVNAAGRGDVAETPGGCVSGRVGRLVDDLCAVVRLGFGILPKHQFVALNRSSALHTVSRAPLVLLAGGVVEGPGRAHL